VDHLDGIHTKDSCHPLLANSTAIITHREWCEFPRRPGTVDWMRWEWGMGTHSASSYSAQAERLPRFTYRRNENNLVKRLKRFLKLHLQLSSVNTASHCDILLIWYNQGCNNVLKYTLHRFISNNGFYIKLIYIPRTFPMYDGWMIW